jgi:hypothetical protein
VSARDLPPFELEQLFAEYEHGNLMLAGSGTRALPVSEFDLDPGDLGYTIPTEGDPEFRTQVGERYGLSAAEVLFT